MEDYEEGEEMDPPAFQKARMKSKCRLFYNSEQ